MDSLMRDVLMVCRERAGISNAEMDTKEAYDQLMDEDDSWEREAVMVCRDRAGISNARVDTEISHKRLIEAKQKRSKDRKPIVPTPPKCANFSGNPYHDSETGQLTSPKTSKKWCWSKYFQCQAGGRSRGDKGKGTRKAISNPPESGRGKDPEGQGCYKCSTNTHKGIPCDKKDTKQAKKQRSRRRRGDVPKTVSKRKTK